MSFLIGLLVGVAVSFPLWVAMRRLLTLRLEPREYKIQLPLLFRVILPAAPQFSPYARRPFLRGYCDITDIRLIQAGLDQQISAEDFIVLRGGYALIFLVFGLAFLIPGNIILGLFGLSLIGFGMIYPPWWLRGQIKRRHSAIQRALPNVLDLLTLSVEAGRDFLTALKDILRHRPTDPLSEELERVFRETQLGKQRRQALQNMGERVQQQDLTSVVNALVQADELGVSLSSILRTLGEQMRSKRFHRAEKLANEAPVKLLMPLMLFIFPAVILIMLGPLLLDSPMMSLFR